MIKIIVISHILNSLLVSILPSCHLSSHSFNHLFINIIKEIDSLRLKLKEKELLDDITEELNSLLFMMKPDYTEDGT